MGACCSGPIEEPPTKPFATTPSAATPSKPAASPEKLPDTEPEVHVPQTATPQTTTVATASAAKPNAAPPAKPNVVAPPAREATLTAPSEAAIGSTISVSWASKTNTDQDFCAIAKVGDKNNTYINYTYTSKGNPVDLVMPNATGKYEIKYMVEPENKVLAMVPIRLVDGNKVTLTVVKEAEIGSSIEINWTGPDNSGDFVAISKTPGGKPEEYGEYSYTSNGSPVNLRAPTEPGEYEIKYMAESDYTVLHSVPIRIVKVGATLDIPDKAMIGSTIQVNWEGPGNDGDFVAVAKMGKKSYIHYTYVASNGQSNGNPVELLMPTDHGQYEIKYMMEENNKVLVKKTIQLIESKATLKCPTEATIGSTIEVSFEGPENASDFIAVGKVSKKKNKPYINYTYVTGNSSPLELLMPTEEGSYEIKYMLEQDNKVLTKIPIELVMAKATIDAPSEADAGSTIQVSWTGPENASDFIGIGRKNKKPAYLNYSYVASGSPLELVLPDQAGVYEIKYMMEQNNKVVAVKPITLK